MSSTLHGNADKLAEKKRAEKEVKEALKSEQRAKKEEKAKVQPTFTLHWVTPW